jgi:hypothetical protein
MPIGNPALDHTEIEAFKKQRAESKWKHTHGCVWADGRVTEHHVPPPKKGDVGQRRGDVPLAWFNGEVMVRKRFKKLGCRRLEDVCIADLGAEAGAKKYAMWKEALKHRRTVEIRNPDALYPPTVLKLRRENAAGVSEDMVFIPDQGLVPATEEMKAERTKALLEAADLPVPTAEDRAAAKKAKA